MNFKKQARDKERQVITDGDILLLDGGKHAVVTRVVRFGRDQVPDLKATVIESNFMGRVTGTKRITLCFDEYRNSIRFDDARIKAMRDDVPTFAKAKELREEVLTRGAF